MTASDLVGRFLLDKDGTKWQDGFYIRHNTSPLFINFYSSSSLVSCSPDQPAFLAFWMATS
jgi:hypothetical protein